MLTRKSPMRRTAMKRAPRKAAPAPEKAHLARVAAMRCMVCGFAPVEVHHVVSDGFQRLTRNHQRVIPLCPVCHRTGPSAVHVIGTAEFNELFGNQFEYAERLWLGGEDEYR